MFKGAPASLANAAQIEDYENWAHITQSLDALQAIGVVCIAATTLQDSPMHPKDLGLLLLRTPQQNINASAFQNNFNGLVPWARLFQLNLPSFTLSTSLTREIAGLTGSFFTGLLGKLAKIAISLVEARARLFCLALTALGSSTPGLLSEYDTGNYVADMNLNPDSHQPMGSVGEAIWVVGGKNNVHYKTRGANGADLWLPVRMQNLVDELTAVSDEGS